MKNIVILFLGILCLSGIGCVSSSINVLYKKEPGRPYAKVLLVYLDEGCDFTVIDSTTYDICMKSCFRKSDNGELRGRVEASIKADMASNGTMILLSSDRLDSHTNSYADFRRVIDNEAIDAILLVDFHMYSHSEHQSHATGSFIKGQFVPGNGPSYKTLNAAYECYLINARTVGLPVWKAQIGIKGKAGAGKNGMSRSMAHMLASNLQANGYIAH